MRKKLTFSLMLFVFAVVSAAMLFASTVVLIVYKSGLLASLLKDVMELEQYQREMGMGINISPGVRLFIGLLEMMLFSIVMALALTWFFGRRALDPLRKVIDATRQVAAGDFNVRVQLKGVGELQELSQSFNKMAQELASIETMRGDFINNISHEIKTPLMSLRGFAKLLRDGDLTPGEREEYLNIIITEAERLAALSTKTLTLSKYEHVEILADRAPFRLDEQIRRTVALAEPLWAAKEIDADVELEEVTFNGNEDLTQQIWMNLLDNAVKFSPRGGKIRIRLRRQDDGIVFTIQDQGIGMESREQARCFDKFYQSDASHANAGNGLGLAIVKRIVELHGGSVEVRSAPGQGSTFTVHLSWPG